MKCPSCGADNPDHVIFCGQCGTKVREVNPKRTFTEESTKRKEEPESHVNENAIMNLSLVSIAINMRRIFIVFGLMVILTVGTSMVSLWISIGDYDTESAVSTLKLWVALAVIILIAGLIYAITQKRLSRASLPPKVLR